jgi:hypothetical protein
VHIACPFGPDRAPPLTFSRGDTNLYAYATSDPSGLILDTLVDIEMARRADELIAALRDQGCHQTDIGDAFYAADPEWLS